MSLLDFEDIGRSTFLSGHESEQVCVVYGRVPVPLSTVIDDISMIRIQIYNSDDAVLVVAVELEWTYHRTTLF